MASSQIDLQALFEADIQHRTMRQADGAMYDMRLLGGVLTSALMASNFSSLNAAVRIPTTLDHPGIPAVK